MSTALQWFKSSYSGSQGGDCLEVAYAWRKSSYSSEQGGACLEVATSPRTIHVRDSKNTDGPALAVTPTTWTAFLKLARG
ncbi:DUF397 domain-containing protein [Streptomyces sp. NBC_00038]|uniref:DUF397 domain-containing protein n=1 Tax=Streptomyces sp. NBC_00038 TaxID=2903615 RepID=UPI00224FF4DA|nr:DUF397 domain-containing protein [Streptomyces sp. NBC_00038]MCX5558460.1 DUF397 domain-containing protein [Streptomyces sp. NBC_00038]